ncbi:preprotein translocase subunit SecG [Candidatus Gottesmanbacteria bacterium RIFCSPLOWO2_01_FULL_46_9]|uniref:Protein-export membrane protein SecG n=1 Tax=Candidatus Gottesmanbacteria bacterium RIFCSPLOWO2_01_FULL_46_9 TaxID=1798394 RepID=A0A1F6AZ24_9BACT|nr:MAG: preprotein translocase subunit SecG [Candidatus Gottesmanbacteria bacterium RIFCSPLOWO2_01_FULL_46_9]
MKLVVLIVHVVIAMGLIGLILLQNSKGGLGGGLGGGEFYRSKRGAERIVFIATIVLAGLFFITSIINLMVR